MGWVLEILAVVMIVMYVLTFISEPKLSMEYTKESFKSLGKLVGWIKGMVNKDQGNTTTVEAKGFG